MSKHVGRTLGTIEEFVEMSAKLLRERWGAILVRTEDSDGADRETWLPSDVASWEWTDEPTGRVNLRLAKEEAERRGLIAAA